MSAKFKSFITDLLAQIDIELGGSRPWDIQVHDDRLFSRVMTNGSLGLGEAYMDGWWDSEAIDQFLYRCLTGQLQSRVKFDPALALLTIKGMVQCVHTKALHEFSALCSPQCGRTKILEALLDLGQLAQLPATLVSVSDKNGRA